MEIAQSNPRPMRVVQVRGLAADPLRGSLSADRFAGEVVKGR